VTPSGTLQLPVPAVNEITQSLPLRTPDAVTPVTEGVQLTALAVEGAEKVARQRIDIAVMRLAILIVIGFA
jgi:hypothetical protein